MLFGFRLFVDESTTVLSASSSSVFRSFSHDENDAINEILKSEISLGRIAGPFSYVPFSDAILTPVFVIEKPSTSLIKKWRFIHNLSEPHGNSVNDAISTDDATVSYDTFDNLISMISSCGQGSLIGKFDIDAAFRILDVDPRDWHFLCFCVNGLFYYEKVMPFGCRVSCRSFEALGSFLIWFLKARTGYDCFFRYVDDFVMVFNNSNSLMTSLWIKSLQLLASLGVPLSPNKICFPCTSVQVLGFHIDTVLGLITIPCDKQAAILELIDVVLRKRNLSKHALETLLGKLCYAARVLRMSRPFLRRLYMRLSLYAAPHHRHYLPSECRRDLGMWRCFFVTPLGPLRIFNNDFISNDTLHLFSDSSAFGFGAVFGTCWFHGSWQGLFIDKAHQNSITILEFFPILVSIFVWRSHLAGKKIVFHCDNMAVVEILNKLTAHDLDILKLLRSFVINCVCSDIEIRAIHVPGTKNQICDVLSRGDLDKFRELFPSACPVPEQVPDDLWSIL